MPGHPELVGLADHFTRRAWQQDGSAGFVLGGNFKGAIPIGLKTAAWAFIDMALSLVKMHWPHVTQTRSEDQALRGQVKFMPPFNCLLSTTLFTKMILTSLPY